MCHKTSVSSAFFHFLMLEGNKIQEKFLQMIPNPSALRILGGQIFRAASSCSQGFRLAAKGLRSLLRSFLQGSWVQPPSQEPSTLHTKTSSFLSPQKVKGPVLGCTWGICLAESPCKVVRRQLSTTASLLFRDSVPHATVPRAGERHELTEGSKKTPPRVGKDHQILPIKTMRWFFRSCTKQAQGRRWQRL